MQDLHALGYKNDLSRVVEATSAVTGESSPTTVALSPTMELPPDCRRCLNNFQLYQLGIDASEDATIALIKRVCFNNLIVSKVLLRQVRGCGDNIINKIVTSSRMQTMCCIDNHCWNNRCCCYYYDRMIEYWSACCPAIVIIALICNHMNIILYHLQMLKVLSVLSLEWSFSNALNKINLLLRSVLSLDDAFVEARLAEVTLLPKVGLAVVAEEEL